jgi:predicted Zn finger-like uncharacterized protein
MQFTDFRALSRSNDHAHRAKGGSAMKIQCQSCQAKYTIADEKVLGKVVKIRCKKCSATIVINGNETRPAEDNADTHVFDYATQSTEQWTVNVADGDQRTLTPQEIANEYKNGVVNDETYCWKDGMADWLPLREIEQLYGLATMGPGRAAAMSFDEISVPPQSVPQPAPLFPAAEPAAAAPAESPFAGAHANGNGSGALFGGGAAAEQVAAPAAARRGGGRGQGADLFGNAATAGGEDDVMTSAASGGGGGAGAAGTAAEKMTGQRNENSVLFSLSALTSTATEEPSGGNKTTATSDGSGLIDIRALSANMGGDEKKKESGGGSSRVDDIMNLSGGGAFGAALAAPILAPPPLDPVDMGLGGNESPAKSAKTLMIAIIGAGALIAIAIIVAVVMVTKSSNTTATPGVGSAPLMPGSVAENDPVTAPGTATATTTAEATASVADNTPPPPGTGHATGSPGAKATHETHATGGGGAAAPKEPAAAPEPKEPPKPTDLGSALAAAAGHSSDTKPSGGGGGGSTAPFDRGAAAASLGGINVGACKKGDGPTGSGHVRVTFAPNGSVSSAVIDSGPFPGTSVGGCIAGKFRGAHVPAFAGGPVTVGKSFTLN